jgi:ferrous iron transport protein A
MMPADHGKARETVTIRKISGRDDIRQHLAELGFVVDTEITVVSEMAGNLIVQVKTAALVWTRPWQTALCLRDRRVNRMKTLKDVKVGETATVKRLHGAGPVKRRIMDMGITKGVDIFVRKVAPLGDPMELNLRGYELSVRKADAEMIEVE